LFGMKPFLVAIAGCSCSGKTAIAEALSRELPGREAAVISMDSYYLDLSHIPEKERALWNFDLPDSIEFELLAVHLRILLDGGEVPVPSYDYSTHTRTSDVDGRILRLTGARGMRSVLILEGLHAMYREEIRGLEDLKVFVDADLDTCLMRRIERDTRERGRVEETVREQFASTVVPMYSSYVEPLREYADIVVDGERPIDESVDKVLGILIPALDF